MTDDRGRTTDRPRRTTWILLLSVVCLLSSVVLRPACAGLELTLEQAIDIALRQNRDLATLRLNLQGAYFGVDLAEAPFGLAFRPDGAVAADDNTRTIDAGLVAGQRLSGGADVEAGARAGQVERDGADDEKHAAVHVQIRQPLFRNAGALVNRENVVRAGNEVLSARRRIELEKADLILRVVELHEDVLRLQQRLAADQQSYKRFDQLFRLTRVRELQGRATRIDTLRAEFERGRAELNITGTSENLDARRRDMADLLALSLDTDVIARPGVDLSVDITTPDEAVSVAVANRLDYAEAIQDLRDAARGVAIARRQLLPDLNVLARYEKLGTGGDFSTATSLDDDAWFVGFSGDTDVPQRSGRAELGRASIDEKTAAQKLLILESALGVQVRQSLIAYDRATKEVGLADRNRLLAESRARLARKMFQMGRADNFTVTDAENGLLDAENDLLSARAGLSISSYRLLRTLGTLIESPDDLKPGAGPADGNG